MKSAYLSFQLTDPRGRVVYGAGWDSAWHPDGGVIVSGASLWILNNKSEAEQQAAWEFIKFLAQPDTQAFWHVNTGYFPAVGQACGEGFIYRAQRDPPLAESYSF